MGALIFYFSSGIQICIAMSDINSSNFPNVLNEIIKKSLFTPRQIEIILKYKDLSDSEFTITKGAYYRQVSQSREKLARLYYSFIVLRVLDILLADDIDVISRLTEQVSVIKDGDVFPEREHEILSVIERVVKQTTGM
uniref:Uncharacterized protein n=1 Tax=uncultured marine thaumarchaeote KM3_46_F12 TaxID=1456160 RepID=A0A075H7W2_9ARCH|nr:hypothetical protein [uncultured marine thaumarchaeote KM3_46_F12]